ncbi:MAG: hypothetical protein WA790_06335 [Sulfitobacter sp.]
MPLDGILSLIGANPIPLLILALLWKGDDFFSPQLRNELSDRLLSSQEQSNLRNWGVPVDSFLSRIFGEKILQKRAFLASYLISLATSLVFVVAIMSTKGYVVSDFEISDLPVFFNFFIGFVLISNPLVDFLSISLLRRSIRKLSQSPSILSALASLVLSILSAGLVFLVGVWLSFTVSDIFLGSPLLLGFGTGALFAVMSTNYAGTDLLFDVTFLTTFCTTFLFQIGLLLIVISAFLFALLSKRTFLRASIIRIFPVEAKPVRTIGIFCALTYGVFLLVYFGIQTTLSILQ